VDAAAPVVSVHPVTLRAPYALPEMPPGRPMHVVDERLVRAPVALMFRVACDVENWPGYLPHYRRVRFRERTADGGGLVEMAASRPFGPLAWPVWWESEMVVNPAAPVVRYRHVRGITRGMDVEWTFAAESAGTRVRIVHSWNGPAWPLIGIFAAREVIGPIFIHGIASRTLDGLALVAEREHGNAGIGSAG